MGTTVGLEQYLDRDDLPEDLRVAIKAELSRRETLEQQFVSERERLETILLDMPVMLDAFDESGTIVFWNHECERVTGYSAAELVGNPNGPRLLYPDDVYRRSVFAEWDSRGEDLHGQATRVTCRDGSVRTIAWSNVSRSAPVPGWCDWAIGIDVTDLERTTRLLEAQRDLGIALSGAETVAEALELCMLSALDVSGFEMGFAYEICDDGMRHLVAHHGVSGELLDTARAVAPGMPESALARVGAPFYATLKDLDIPTERMSLYRDMRAVALLHIGYHDEHVGTLAVVSTEQDTVPEWIRAALETICSQVGSAIAGLRARDAVRQSEARYRAIFETGLDGLVLVDMTGHIIDANQVYVDMLGYDIEELKGISYRDLTPPQWLDAEADIIEREVIGRGYSEPYEKEYICKDGSVFPILIRAWLVRDADGNPIGMAGWVRDMTEEKRTEAELEMLARFPAENPNCVMRTDADGNLTYANESSGRLLAAWRCAVGERIPEQWREQVMGALQADRIVEAECDCGECVYSLMFAPIVDTGYVNIYGADITSRVEAERERGRLEAQIQAAQKLESLGVLAGGIAHDFNNILVGILGNADLAMMDLAPESPVRRRLAGIIEASERAADLTNQMLAYSGKGRFVVERVDITRLVQEMAHLLEVSASKKAVIKYDLSTDQLPPVEADVTQVRQVMVNLVTNASEALVGGVGIIAIRTSSMHCNREYLRSTYIDEELPEGLYVVLEVSDTGCGMDSETLEQIFDPFFTTKFTGRGLGLAAVLGIIRGHKGAVKVYSEPAHGTSFRVLLPAAEAADTAEAVDASTQNQAVAGTVLVVDDEEIVRDLASDMLRRLGLEVIPAADGAEALELYAECGDSLSLVVLDMTMPRMSGEEAFRRMKRLRADIPILVTSGYNEQEAIERFAGQGLAGFIQKPYQFGAFGEAVRRALEL
ncbi:MAG TPA: hypothetical protein DGT21_07365 [Armatimonadetes bacterium]|nr:hypothetical protein [Armatimonadota bacterium]